MKALEINFKTVKELRKAVTDTKTDPLVNFHLSFSLLEGTLWYCTFGYLLLEGRDAVGIYQRIRKDSVNIKFSEMVRHFAIHWKNIDLAEKLNEIGKKRNQLIHSVVNYTSYERYLEECKAVSSEINLIERKLLKKYFPE